MTATPRNDGSPWIWAILLGLASVTWVLAIALGSVAGVLERRVEAALAWPTTDGVVLRSAVVQVDHRDPKDGTTRTQDDLDFAYAYEVGGQQYEGHDFDVSGTLGTSDLERIAAAHPVGAHVQVHYDPAEPANAALSLEGSALTRVFRALAYGLAAIGLVFASFGVRSLLRRRRAQGSSSSIASTRSG